MPKIQKKAVSKHSAEQLFSVVNDIEHYPEFIEWCPKVDILKKTESVMQACLHLQKGLLKYSLTTENTLVYPTSMQMRLLSGPFKQFAGQWQFIEQDNQRCEIEFILNYEFSNRLLEMSAGKIFFSIADEMVQNFLKRADDLYAS